MTCAASAALWPALALAESSAAAECGVLEPGARPSAAAAALAARACALAWLRAGGSDSVGASSMWGLRLAPGHAPHRARRARAVRRARPVPGSGRPAASPGLPGPRHAPRAAQELSLTLFDHDTFDPDDRIGAARLPVRELANGEKRDLWLDVDVTPAQESEKTVRT